MAMAMAMAMAVAIQQEETKKAEAERIEKQLAKYDRIGDRIADRLIAKYEQLIQQNKGE